MLKLLSKEFKLFLVKPTLLFFLLAATMLIPSYPAFISTFFVFFIIQICYTTAQKNRDIEFTAMLPVSRKQIVLSKVLSTAIVQNLYIIACIPFAIISSLILNTSGNLAGMDKNIAFFGYALVSAGIFNLIFFPLYFKNTHKEGFPLIMGLLGYFIFSVIFEVIVALVPAINKTLDTLNKAMLVPQIVFLLSCIVIYFAMMVGSYKLAAKAFEKMVI